MKTQLMNDALKLQTKLNPKNLINCDESDDGDKAKSQKGGGTQEDTLELAQNDLRVQLQI